jgi:DNA-binding NarL/FixJ family response regulator
MLVVEDDDDVRSLVRLYFGLDPGFELDGQAVDIPSAVAAARADPPDLVVLDHLLEGDQTGLDGAELLKQVAPAAKVILFSATEELRIPALESPYVDAFVLKTDIDRLVELSRDLLGIS